MHPMFTQLTHCIFLFCTQDELIEGLSGYLRHHQAFKDSKFDFVGDLEVLNGGVIRAMRDFKDQKGSQKRAEALSSPSTPAPKAVRLGLK